MNNVGNLSALSTPSLVRDGAEFCEELVRRGGRALTIPFGNRRIVVSFRWMSEPRRRPDPQITPELTDHELVKIASRYGASYEPAWERGLTLQYGGLRRH
jgi:hypothetical protein